MSKNIKNVHEQNFDKKRIVKLDKEKKNQRINLNSKYRSLTFFINILILCSVTTNSETKKNLFHARKCDIKPTVKFDFNS